MRDLLVAIPVKDAALAKTRLRPVLSDHARAALARQLLTGLLQQLVQLRGQMPFFDISVVTASPDMAALARAQGAQIIPEGAARGLNAAAHCAAACAVAGGWRRLCILPGDLAAPGLHDLHRLLAWRPDGAAVGLCPAHDLGTNALMISPPQVLDFGFGPRSFLRHYRRAMQRGIRPVVLPFASLRHDVDTAADLPRLQKGG
ncbi:2-phospho-L-lactate guanylyltransferase [Paracoccus jiaweipingae]|uniref:2-phospho-L-lactate guanylyltransferase n=1 Tax=unclassified Paracoccus (in: a-proteobacteria) TaxID=2688777 RepID=UPI0037A90F7D